MIKYTDCHCEDYPCCGHYDLIYGDEEQLRDPDDLDDFDDGEYPDDDGPFDDDEPRVRLNAFGQRLRYDAPELPGDHWLIEEN